MMKKDTVRKIAAAIAIILVLCMILGMFLPYLKGI